MENDPLEVLAGAVTNVANARSRIPLDRLLRETALNVLILSRIAANQLEDNELRANIDGACDRLVDLLRQVARQVPGG